MSMNRVERYRTRTATFIVPLFLLLMAVGCGSTSQLTRRDVIHQYDSVARLSDGLEDARGRDGELLAPKHFATVEAQLEDAFKHARKADKPGAEEAAQRGLESLAQLHDAMRDNRKYMDEVVSLRIRAREQGAASLFEKEFLAADERFRATSRLLEDGNIERSNERRPELIRTYAALELKGLKRGTVAKAEQAIASASNAGADKHAPKTMESARAELKLALSVLDADRTQVDKSNAYAQRATWLANRAREIAALVTYFRAQGFTNEDRVLWYQDQLQRVGQAVRDEPLPFDQGNAKAVQALRDDVLALHSGLNETRRTNSTYQNRISQLEQSMEAQRKMHEKEMEEVLQTHRKQLEESIAASERQLAAITSGSKAQLMQAQKEAQDQIAALKRQQSLEISTLEERLSLEAQARADAEQREIRDQARFEQAQAFFAASDAEVFRQGDNVLIRLKGFYFAPGSHEVEARNYGLLNNVIAAINVFPTSTVKIIGHTDASGSSKHNVEVSAARAQSVVRFLSTVGGIDLNRLVAEGRGEEEPLATNETPEGRSKNRRIDILIINEGKSPSVATKEGAGN